MDDADSVGASDVTHSPTLMAIMKSSEKSSEYYERLHSEKAGLEAAIPAE